MAKKEVKIDIDESAFYDDEPSVEQIKQAVQSKQVMKEESKTTVRSYSKNAPINCLRNEKIIVRFVPKKTDNIVDKRHVAYGGMMDNAVRVFVPPMLSSGSYKNCLTDNEKSYLEDVMGLDYNALSVHKKDNNFWDSFSVRLYKQDNILDLSDPNDYIKYKVLLANKDLIAPNVRTLKEFPKATYQYVIMEEGDENVNLKDTVNTVMKCYEELGRIKDDFDTMRCVIETLDGRSVAANTKIEFLQSKAHELIGVDSKMFLNIITDPLLNTKVLIKKAIEAGVISKRGDYYYLREDGSPLCGNNEDPTITVAAKYLSLPKNQELKFAIEAKTK
jgi:hypothetical protein